MNNKLIVSIIVVVLIIGAVLAVYYFGIRKPEIVEGPESESVNNEQQDKSILELVLANPKTEMINLEPVDGSSSFGNAYRMIKDGVLYHAVVASMPDLEGNDKYEGWLVQPEPLMFFSTGIMTKNEQGEWILEFKSSQPLPDYYRVAITLEKKVDPISEKHIIQGDFSQGIDFGHELEVKEELVEIKQFLFSPSKIIVKKGTTIVWVNRDGVGHTATSYDDVFDSGLLSQGEEYSYTFNETGVFDYFCKPHPFMVGQIVVE